MEASEQTYSGNGAGQTPWQAHEAGHAPVGRPEIPVLAAFAGGFILAKLIKAMGPDDE